MSPPSPKKKNGGNPAPRQIRFVATDGQPQTKRRRVNAAYVDHIEDNFVGQDADVTSLCANNDTQAPADKSTKTNAPGLKDISSFGDTSSFAKELDTHAIGDSPASGRTSVSSASRTHVPYFRYFGPTAIVPGFKQMVVQVRGSRRSNPSMSSDSPSPLRSPKPSDIPTRPLATAAENRDTRDANIPFYDRDDTLPVSNLAPPIDRSQPLLDDKKWDRGLPFGHRAMSALVDSLPCPTLSAVQACLLLAYEQFGSNHDSGLWMYLGISIRMAQDLGLQKFQGLKHNYGRTGVTPSEVMTGHAGKLREEQYDDLDVHLTPKANPQPLVEERARERERVDSFWSIFFLDRVISSGTGRPVTLRDEDIELCFPLQSESQLPNGWPAPFPPLIRIIHLYGRVTDLINGIQDVKLVTPDTLKMLAGMESDLTSIYQHLSPRLHFNAANFQAYVKAKEGTNFILLHFWFHTLIVLLHQPTLLNSFGGSIQHLYPNSRELSMSSAKTIADILSFSELVDGKSFIGNPFTSQPMYIAACAFLMESAYYAFPSSGAGSNPPQPLLANQSSGFVMPTMESSNGTERKSTAKHILLASAARENYQRCYKALKALNAYWEGTGYILTVLDQKAKGIVDPLLYAVEDIENTAGIAPGQPLGKGAWRAGKAPADSGFDPERPAGVADISSDGKWSPHIDPSQAIGWALTGATNSSQPNLSLLYQMSATESPSNRPTYSSQYSHSYPVLPTNTGEGQSSSYPPSIAPARAHEEMTPSLTTANAKYSNVQSRTISSDPSYYMSMNPTYSESNTRTTRHVQTSQSTFPAMLSSALPTSHMGTQPSAYNYSIPQTAAEHQTRNQMGSRDPGADLQPTIDDANRMMIGSHEVDMNSIHHQDSFPFANGEILPWLEYLPQDVLSFFGDHHNYPLMSPDDVSRPP
ncbi:Transcription factor [Penicillium fimorum]|uniref:Transcription factor n=1 Tax=Penicillium fimorum TaxID=1882269 RepID=A0A9W9XIS0_9EURO|nr:Transcription factor [Penicillium fimorum]